MGKSQGREFIQTMFPHCFDINAPRGSEIVITDAISAIFKFGSVRSGKKTWNDLVCFMAKMVLGPFVDPSVIEHVVVFDKSEWTPPTKRPNEDKRFEDGHEELLLWSRQLEEKGRENDFAQDMEELPSPWSTVMSDRKCMRAWTVRYLCRSLLDAKMPLHLSMHAFRFRGVRIVFDGHCIDQHTAKTIDSWTDADIWMNRFGGCNTVPTATPWSSALDDPWVVQKMARCSTEEHFLCTPIAVSINTYGGRSVSQVHEARNYIGEADMAIFVHASRAMERMASRIVVCSIDIDVVYMGLVYLTRVGLTHGSDDGLPSLLIRNEYPSWCPAEHVLFIKGESQWGAWSNGNAKGRPPASVDIGALRLAIIDFMDRECIPCGLGSVRLPTFGQAECEPSAVDYEPDCLGNILSFITCIVTAGSDYTEGVPGLATSFYKVCEQRMKYVGRLVSFTDFGDESIVNPCPRIEGDAFARLICEAYWARKKKSTDRGKCPPTDQLRAMIEKSNQKTTINHMSSPLEISQNMANVGYYLMMIYQTGRTCLQLPEGDELIIWGYSIKNELAGWSRGNLQRSCGERCNNMKKDAKEEKKRAKQSLMTTQEVPLCVPAPSIQTKVSHIAKKTAGLKRAAPPTPRTITDENAWIGKRKKTDQGIPL